MIALLLLAQEYAFDPWEAWNAFKEGSSVEYEVVMSETTIVQSKTIAKKEEKVITLKTVVRAAGSEVPGEEPVRKPEGATTECPLCGEPVKNHADPGKWSDDKVKVGDRELACRRWQSPEKMCNGNEMPKTTIWYSKEVPGHIVKLETSGYALKVTRFDVK